MMKSKVKSQKSKIVLLAVFLSFIGGCAGFKDSGAKITEGFKGILGISTKEIENSRPLSEKKVFKYEYGYCRDLVEKSLRHMGSYIFANNPDKDGMLAIYVTKDDTTVVGVFFKKIDEGSTQVEISSASTFAKELVAGRLYAYLDNPKKLLEKPVDTDKEKEKK